MPVEPPIPGPAEPSVPPPETTPGISQPGQPTAPPPEISPPGPDVDVPDPQPGFDPGIAPGQPTA